MRILSKSILTTMAAALVFTSCARVLPWRDQPVGNEINLAFTLEQNLIQLRTVRIDNRTGRYILGTAAPRTVVDPRVSTAGAHALQLNERRTVRIAPATLDLGGVADAIIGADAWSRRAISIDYRTGLVTWQREGIHPGLMKLYSFDAEPMIYVNVNGTDVGAIVDTTSPDTLVLPSRESGRGTARLAIAGTEFGTMDVRYAPVSRARVGNRLLSKFLVSIDYRRRVVGLWRDPRIPLAAP